MRAALFVCVLVCACGVFAKSKDEKVKIAVYYESLCPDSKQFITKQLAPVWDAFRGSIKVKLVPYGKATHNKVNGQWQFTCHHGADECYGNKVQACVLKDKHFADTEKMELVICMMGQAEPDKALETCLSRFDKSSRLTEMTKCAGGAAGDSLLASYGDKTNALQKPLSFVPSVVINEQFNQAVQEEAFKDLKKVVCSKATTKPSACL